jgi:hypothetical protein
VRLGNGGIAPVAVELVLVLFDVLENIGFEIGTRGHVHDLKNGDQRVVVVQRMLARNQLAQPPKQLLQAQVGSEAFVKGVFVKDHAGGFLGAQWMF